MIKPGSQILLSLVLLAGLCCGRALSAEKANIVVAADGAGDFRSIQEALESIPSGNETPVVILIRCGVYREKLFITRSYVTLVGENRDSTRIVYAELREQWNKAHGSDWGAAVVNIDSGVTDITLANLTVYNNYGSLYGTYDKHQFAIRGAGTRVMLLHCNVIADGGDTVSLWDRETGMYYHADCYFEGGVDFVCPRGWCYVTGCRFFGHNLSASIWHDGSRNEDMKFVLRDSFFDGVAGFPLGRNHRDGQFFLLDCVFSNNMADRPIYRPESSPSPFKWGGRYYFYGCRRECGDFSWYKDNLETAKGSPNERDITAKWTFGGRWDPEGTMPSVLPFAFLPSPKEKAARVDADDVTLSWVSGRNAVEHVVYFGRSIPPELKGSQKTNSLNVRQLQPLTTYYWRVDEVTDAGTVEGRLWKFTTK